jgi:hypothetical protein
MTSICLLLHECLSRSHVLGVAVHDESPGSSTLFLATSASELSGLLRYPSWTIQVHVSTACVSLSGIGVGTICPSVGGAVCKLHSSRHSLDARGKSCRAISQVAIHPTKYQAILVATSPGSGIALIDRDSSKTAQSFSYHASGPFNGTGGSVTRLPEFTDAGPGHPEEDDDKPAYL